VEIPIAKEQQEPVVLPVEMPILPVKGIVVFPFLVVPLIITEKSHIQLIDEALMQGKTIGIFNSKDPDVIDPGFDDIVVLAPVAAVISEAATYLAPGGVMNVFAGVLRGTMAQIDLSRVYLDDIRVIGHTASSIDDLKLMLFQAESDLLSPNRSVAAIGSLEAASEGLVALRDAVYPGKVVVFPNIRPLPVTAVTDLKETMPSVYAKLRDGREWTVEAENEFLDLMAK